MFGSSYKLPIDIVRFSQPEPPKKAKPPTAKTNDDVALITEALRRPGTPSGSVLMIFFRVSGAAEAGEKRGLLGWCTFKKVCSKRFCTNPVNSCETFDPVRTASQLLCMRNCKPLLTNTILCRVPVLLLATITVRVTCFLQLLA